MATILLLIIVATIAFAAGYMTRDVEMRVRDIRAREFHKIKSPWAVSSPGSATVPERRRA